jgi:hypothetical protein
MAKGTGIYGNFNGKIGNTVGFKIAQSRNRQNQGVRIYQPSVGNPKTAAQAEQRARVAAVQATYTMLRGIIDRGNERQPYGYASRVAWLRQAYRSEIFPWYQKGAHIASPVICPLTFGTLPELDWSADEDYIVLNAQDIPDTENLEDIGGVSYWIQHYNTFLREGDQLTFITLSYEGSETDIDIFSFILDKQSGEYIDRFNVYRGTIRYESPIANGIAAIIVSREGALGKHIRSSSALRPYNALVTRTPYDAASKAAAIASYQSAGSANSDWSEDPDI